MAADAAQEPIVAIIPFETKIDFMRPRWNRDAWARIQADMDSSKERICYCTGNIIAVRPGEALKPFLGFHTFLATRLLPLPDGNIRRVNKEVIFYANLTKLGQAGDIIDRWHNPFNNEDVRVVHAVNDPFNYTISETLILVPEDFRGDRTNLPKIPLIFPWQQMDDETLMLATDMHLNYPNPLQPDKWPRESAGPRAQVTEMMRYFVKRKDLENPAMTAVPYVGTWHRVSPWLPWMLMGQAPGHCMYTSTMTAGSTTAIIPAAVREYAEKNCPQMLTAPTEDYGPSHSSLELYSRQQTPMPPK